MNQQRPRLRRVLRRSLLGIVAALGSAALSSCDRAEAPTTSIDTAVAVQVGGVGFDEAARVPVVVLEETDGGRILPIWIGAAEAHSIASEIQGAEAPRPNTHDLARTLIDELGARVLRATVTELRGSTYYAVLRVEGDDGIHEVDARPSDAIAVALRFDAPLFVSVALFDARAARGAESRAAPKPDEPKDPAEAADPLDEVTL